MSLRPPETFRHCPMCGKQPAKVGGNPFRCKSCGFVFYFGPAVAVGGILTDAEGRILLIRRARDPGAGKYGLPGGFVDEGETGEEAVIREIKEEVGLTATVSSYLCSFENLYDHNEIIAPILDIYYLCQTESFDDLALAPDEVSEFEFAIPTKAHLDNMAFPANRRALETYTQRRALNPAINS